MVFNSTTFVVFFSVFLATYYLLLGSRPAKLWGIVLGSLVFYAGWNFRYVPILLGTALFDFTLAKRIEATPNRRGRRLLLWASVCSNLGVLAYFKYTNFLLESGYGFLHLLGLTAATAPV